MFRFLITSVFSYVYLMASTSSPMVMASDLNLTQNQIKQLQRIDATVEEVKRYSHAKRIEVLTPQQRKLFLARQKTTCNND
jgi:hypothetical protein